MTDATLSLATFNRPKGLERLLRALLTQDVGDYNIVVLIIDNACDAATREMVSELSKSSEYLGQYVEEPQRGIVAARNKAVEVFLNSDSQNLAFIDDDEWPRDDNWIMSLLVGMDKHNADIVTGPVIAVNFSGVPNWVTSVIHDFGKHSPGERVKYFYTNNLLVSRRVLEKMRPAFDNRFAMIGGSDYHFAIRCLAAGFRAIYIDAPVMEEIPASRATVNWFALRGFRSGIGYTRAHLIEEGVLKGGFRSIFMAGIRLARGGALLVAGLATLSKARLVNGMFRVGSCVGTIAGLFGASYREYLAVHGE